LTEKQLASQEGFCSMKLVRSHQGGWGGGGRHVTLVGGVMSVEFWSRNLQEKKPHRNAQALHPHSVIPASIEGSLPNIL
jgi:hypothetical protein